MADGVIIHREGMPAGGTWQVRPPALAGIVPVAAIAYCGTATYADGVISPDGYRAVGICIDGDCHCRSSIGVDGFTSTNVRGFEDPDVLLFLADADNSQTLFETGAPSLVSGGLDVPIVTAVNQPDVFFIFFFGVDWQAAIVRGAGLREANPSRNLNTGFIGANLDNQVLFELPGVGETIATGRRTTTNFALTPLGIATRRVSPGPAADQWAVDIGSRDGWGNAVNSSALYTSAHVSVTYAGVKSRYAVGDWGDDYVEWSWVDGGFISTNSLVISTPSKAWFAAVVDSPVLSGSWAITGAPFAPDLAFLVPTSNLIDNSSIVDDCGIGGLAAVDGTVESSLVFSDWDGATDPRVKTLQNSQFLDALVPDGTRGWSAPAGNVTLTADGFRVDNVTVNPGHAETVRRWGILLGEASGGPAPVSLQIDDLVHLHPLDSVSIEASFTLIVDGMGHGSRLDDCDVSITESISLLIDALRHGHPVDEILLGSEWTLLPDSLRHAHPLDPCNAYWHVDLLTNGLLHVHPLDSVDIEAAPEIVLDVDALRHTHPVDGLLVTYETSILIDFTRHAHFVDAPDVSALLGLLTTLRRNDATWRINAGQSVDNAAGVDGLWHVVEAIFDGAGSILSIDGAPVAGNAGVRELQSLTLGAELDGGERLTGDVGELRIYNGALTQTQRDKIRAELQAKWL